MKLIGVISDTHGLLRPEAVAALKKVDLIIHAGDIGKEEVLEGLRQIAPVTAIRGNCDRGSWAKAYPETAKVEIENIRILILHDVKQLDFKPEDEKINIVISGHSHKPKEEIKDGVTYINPGAAGPKRFSLPVSVALLQIDDSGVKVNFMDII